MPQAIVFDIDGTLVTFQFDVQGTRKALIDLLTSRGYDASGLGLKSPTQSILEAAKAQAEASGKSEEFDKLRAQIFSVLDEFEIASVDSTMVFPGTQQTLDYLRARGVRTAVMSNSGRKAAVRALEKAGILDRFEFVLTRDETFTMKPRPDGILLAVQKLGLSADDVFYVGDSTYDIIASKRAGVKVVSVATGNYDEARLKAEGADQVIAGITELPAVLGL